MAQYHFYIDKNFKVIASITELDNEQYVCTHEGDTQDMMDIINIISMSVDATLLALDTKRRFKESN